MIRVALGTANVLGLMDIKARVHPTTAHLLTPGKCIYDCKFCTQAKSSSSDEKLLSRISWPIFEEELVFSKLKENQNMFQRVCLQVVHSNEYDFLNYIPQIKSSCNLPLSVDLKAEDTESIGWTFEAGADVVGLPLDGANPKVYSKVKEGDFYTHLNLIKQAAGEFPNRISTHLIIGLGESQKDAILLIKELYELKVTLGLFAFTPVKGTALEDNARPSVRHYRRIQLARFLIFNNHSPEFDFDEKGNIMSYGLKYNELLEAIKPSAFKTTGCLGCNRPYYNETPGGVMYNYPEVPSPIELKAALNEALSDLEAYRG
jgi:biotin synthase